MNETIRLLTALRKRLQERSDKSYCDMIEAARLPEALGWEEKAKTGSFGQRELKAHRRVGTLLGKHRAYADARDDVDALILQLENREPAKNKTAQEREVNGRPDVYDRISEMRDEATAARREAWPRREHDPMAQRHYGREQALSQVLALLENSS